MLDQLDGESQLKISHRVDAVRAHLLELAGQADSAVRHYRSAAAKTASLPERNYLLAQAARLSLGQYGNSPS